MADTQSQLEIFSSIYKLQRPVQFTMAEEKLNFLTNFTIAAMNAKFVVPRQVGIGHASCILARSFLKGSTIFASQYRGHIQHSTNQCILNTKNKNSLGGTPKNKVGEYLRRIKPN